MANIDLDIRTAKLQGKDKLQTHTTRTMKWYDTIVFHNWDPEQSLAVIIETEPDRPGPVLCQADGTNGPMNFSVPPRQSSAAYKICRGYSGMYFKYTAQIGPGAYSDAEDPIIIIERK
jgi:hypothetical protein